MLWINPEASGCSSLLSLSGNDSPEEVSHDQRLFELRDPRFGLSIVSSPLMQTVKASVKLLSRVDFCTFITIDLC